MITIQDLQKMLDEAVESGRVRPDSEVRYVDRDRNDCSFEPQWKSIGPGFCKNGTPVDRRFGTGTMFLAQESRLRPAPEQLCLALDW
jgi:hypothetical protein